jgi:catechol 2,3-dioxygenase-like lactoylglutathione lyase family enzyme
MGKVIFHHVCMLAGERALADKCEYFYRKNFGMRMAYDAVTDDTDFVFLADNVNDVENYFEIIGETAEPREVEFLEKNGTGLDHLCFLVDDLQAMYDDLVVKGVEFHIPPYEAYGSLIAWCKDPSGVEIELLQTDIDMVAGESKDNAPEAQYNHVCILAGSRELAQQVEDFYKKHFGMEEILRGGPSEEMDWVYLKDGAGSPLWLEIVGAAIFENEKEFIEKNGPGLEHHCYVVADADKCYQWLIGNDVKTETEVMDFCGARMFFLRDPIGVRIQVLQMPEDV